MLEFARGLAGAGEDRGAVAIGDRLASSIAASRSSMRITFSTGPKISSLATVMPVCTSSSTVAPRKKPFGAPSTLTPRPSAGIFAPSFTPISINCKTRSRCWRVMTGPMSGCGSRSVGPTLIRRVASTSEGKTVLAASPTTTAVEPAMQRSPAQPNAASMTPRTEFSTSASGMRNDEILRAAVGLDPFAVFGAGLVDVSGNRRRADKRNRLHLRMREQRVHALRVRRGRC